MLITDGYRPDFLAAGPAASTMNHILLAANPGTLTPLPGTQTGSTHMTRVVTLGIPWPLKLFQPVLVGAFAKESRRTLLALGAYAGQQTA